MEHIPPCLETILLRAKAGDDAAVLVLQGLHEHYSQNRTTAGSPVPVVDCPLRRCGRDRMVDFLGENSVATTDYDTTLPYIDACRQGLGLTVIDYPPTGPVDRQPPLPPIAA